MGAKKKAKVRQKTHKTGGSELKGNPKVILHHNPGGGADILTDGLRRDRDILASIREEGVASLFGQGKYPL